MWSLHQHSSIVLLTAAFVTSRLSVVRRWDAEEEQHDQPPGGKDQPDHCHHEAAGAKVSHTNRGDAAAMSLHDAFNSCEAGKKKRNPFFSTVWCHYLNHKDSRTDDPHAWSCILSHCCITVDVYIVPWRPGCCDSLSPHCVPVNMAHPSLPPLSPIGLILFHSICELLWKLFRCKTFGFHWYKLMTDANEVDKLFSRNSEMKFLVKQDVQRRVHS